MPEYLYQNEETLEVVSVIQRMDEEHVYEKDGKKWTRIFVNPTVAVDTKADAFSEKDFVKATANKNYRLGDLWDKSAELSEKRAKAEGADPIKEKAMEAYEKKCKKAHPHRKQRIETDNFIIE